APRCSRQRSGRSSGDPPRLPLAVLQASPTPSVVADHAVERSLPLGVTGHTPAHRQGGHLGELRHRLYLPVALLAGQPYLDMALVRKVHDPGDLVDTGPLDWLPVLPEGAELLDFLLELGVFRGDDLVTAHAPLDGGKAGERGTARVGVAVLAVDLELTRVNLVAEQDRLLRALGDGRLGVSGRDADHEVEYRRD